MLRAEVRAGRMLGDLMVSLAQKAGQLTPTQRYIDKHLDSPRLSADAIARCFGWSRATLYRLFEPDGGLMKYIQRRRL